MNGITEVIHQNESKNLLTSLEKLSHSVSVNQYLVGNAISIADIAVSAQLSLLRFPFSSGEKLCNKGCKGFNDNLQLESLFNWRDKLEETLLEIDPAII